MGMDKTKEKKLHCQVTVRLLKDTKAFGPGLAELLAGICRCGSLQGAAREMDMSYSKAWTLIKDAEKNWGFPLTDKYVGGKDGGRSVLTPQAAQVLKNYQALQQSVKSVADSEFSRYFEPLGDKGLVERTHIMDRNRKLVIVRGGGDIATGTIQALNRAGFAVLVLEAAKPSSIRRKVALSEAVYDGHCEVEDVTCIRCANYEEAGAVMNSGDVALLIDEPGRAIHDLKPWAVVDAILAKKNLGTRRDMAAVTIGLGPGFTAGDDVDLVIETMRGHNLGRIISQGSALPNTGTPGLIAGYGKERVVHSPAAGTLCAISHIGDIVKKGQPIATIRVDQDNEVTVPSPLDGLLRGLIRDGFQVTKGLKIADVDPRESEYANCFTISDKARCIGGAVISALMAKLHEPVAQNEVGKCGHSYIGKTGVQKRIS